ncbi:MAG: heavy metal translocating P-type ATPase [Hyphomonas sp.]|nr:heavy metal translocating P-type ATPase [Hyphomonas sp.]
MTAADFLTRGPDWSLSPERQQVSKFDDLGVFVTRQGKQQHLELNVSGAKCGACMAKIENGVRALEGVSESRLNLSTGRFNVTWSGALPASKIAETIEGLGYGVGTVSDSDADEARRKEERGLLIAMGVAAFAAANIMLLSVSVWGDVGEMGGRTRQILHAISGIIAFPAIAFSGRPFFRSAWNVLRRGRANMDVPISLAVTLAFGVSVAETIRGGEHAYFDASVMLLFFLLIGRFLEARVRRRAGAAANDLLAMSNRAVTRLDKSGEATRVNAAAIAEGDMILLSQGERAVVDLELCDDICELDESLVTGETAPRSVSAGARIYAGSVNIAQPVRAKALSRASNSLLADISRMLEAGEQRRSSYRYIADKAVSLYVPFVHTTALLTFTGWLIAGAGIREALLIAISTLIITCPCALALAAPVAHVVAAGKLFSNGIFLKSGDALERLASVDHIVLDKTGTLSVGQPRVAEQTDRDLLADAALLARASSHPLSRAIVAAACPGPIAPGVREIPGQGLEATIDGAVWRLGSAAWAGGEDAAGTVRGLYLRQGNAEPRVIHFEDEIIPGTQDGLRTLTSRGYELEILSGDTADRVSKVASELGIGTFTAGVSPKEKTDRLEALRSEGHKVLMVGDGLNDAGALAMAHAAVAPGTAVDLSQSASDAVYAGGIGALPLLLTVARRTKAVMLQNFWFAALYNLVAIPIAVTGHATPLVAAIAMSLSSMAVSLNALRLASIRKGT